MRDDEVTGTGVWAVFATAVALLAALWAAIATSDEGQARELLRQHRERVAVCSTTAESIDQFEACMAALEKEARRG